MADPDNEPAYKFMMNDLSQFVAFNGSFGFVFDKELGTITEISKFQIQGTVVKVTGLDNEIFILDDGSGKAKVTRGQSVPGDFSWLKAGSYCSVIGTLEETGKLPHVLVVKLAQISNPVLQETWPLEVDELKNLMSKKVTFKLS